MPAENMTEALRIACLHHSRSQSTTDKVAIAQRTCRVQAAEAARAGRFGDAAEWDCLAKWVGVYK